MGAAAGTDWLAVRCAAPSRCPAWPNTEPANSPKPISPRPQVKTARDETIISSTPFDATCDSGPIVELFQSVFVSILIQL